MKESGIQKGKLEVLDEARNLNLPNKPANIQYLTEKEAARLLSCSRQTLANQRHLGRGLPFAKFGKKSVRYKLQDVLSYLEGRTVRPVKD